jgi:hypothetical protein
LFLIYSSLIWRFLWAVVAVVAVVWAAAAVVWAAAVVVWAVVAVAVAVVAVVAVAVVAAKYRNPSHSTPKQSLLFC